jgi:hypothetical protein
MRRHANYNIVDSPPKTCQADNVTEFHWIFILAWRVAEMFCVWVDRPGLSAVGTLNVSLRLDFVMLRSQSSITFTVRFNISQLILWRLDSTTDRPVFIYDALVPCWSAKLSISPLKLTCSTSLTKTPHLRNEWDLMWFALGVHIHGIRQQGGTLCGSFGCHHNTITTSTN